MKKMATTLKDLKKDIRGFYDPNQYHFIVMNAVDMQDKTELQWFFSEYAPPYETICFYATAEPGEMIPSICSIVSSAWVAEAELTDLMDITIENAPKGFVLDPDSAAGPLRKKKTL